MVKVYCLVQEPLVLTGQFVVSVHQYWVHQSTLTITKPSHLGYNVYIHKEYYRLHDNTIELSKVSHLLVVVDIDLQPDWLYCTLDLNIVVFDKKRTTLNSVKEWNIIVKNRLILVVLRNHLSVKNHLYVKLINQHYCLIVT